MGAAQLPAAANDEYSHGRKRLMISARNPLSRGDSSNLKKGWRVLIVSKSKRSGSGGYPGVSGQIHPRAAHGYVRQHILVAEKALGHYLPNNAVVHHVDRDKKNNANANLVICEDSAYHCLLHVRQRIVDAGGDPNNQKLCHACRELKNFSDFTRGNTYGGKRHICRACAKVRNAKIVYKIKTCQRCQKSFKREHTCKISAALAESRPDTGAIREMSKQSAEDC